MSNTEVIKNYLTISQLTAIVKQKLYTPELNEIWVLGEISDLKSYKRGEHAYFSLKDNYSLLSCVFFRGDNRFFDGKLENGMKVFAFGSIDVYAPRGRYQLIVRRVIPYGEGEFALKIKALEEKLKKEGLFDRKRPVPDLPETIGLITSDKGAAIKDFLKMAKEVPYLKIILYPALVQGDEAPQSIIEGIEQLNLIDEVEVIVITRGGGSEEDLRCFYDEGLVRAIYNSKKPVISAIGHERDVVFTDRVADLRKATPTDAGKFFAEAYRKRLELFNKFCSILEKRMAFFVEKPPYQEKLNSLTSSLKFYMQSLIDSRYQQLDYLKEKLNSQINQSLVFREHRVKSLSIKIHPKTLIANFNSLISRLNHLNLSLKRGIEKRVEAYENRVKNAGSKLAFRINERYRDAYQRYASLSSRLDATLVLSRIDKKGQSLSFLKNQMVKEMENYINNRESLISVSGEKLNHLSPLNILSRGYAIVSDSKGSIVKSVSSIEEGSEIRVKLRDGSLNCNVKEIEQREG